MHLGLIMECELRPGTTEEQSFSDAFALSSMCEDLGLDGVWLAERHFAAPERVKTATGGGVPSFASAPLILPSAIAGRTTPLQIVIAVIVLPHAHPVRLAEEVATLDQISRGRLHFGVGRSGFATSYEGYGVDYAESRQRFQECFDILINAWTQPSFSYEGEHFSFKDVHVVPKPFQKPHPPIVIAATTQDTFPMVGAMGYPLFAGLRGMDVNELRVQLDVYQAAWKEAGHPGRGPVFLRVPVFVAPTTEQAQEEPRASTLWSYSRLAESFAKSAAAVTSSASEDRASRGARLGDTGYDQLLATRLAYGTPEQVTARLLQMRDELGLEGIVIEPNVGGSTAREPVMASVKLYCEEVAPHLR